MSYLASFQVERKYTVRPRGSHIHGRLADGAVGLTQEQLQNMQPTHECATAVTFLSCDSPRHAVY